MSGRLPDGQILTQDPQTLTKHQTTDIADQRHFQRDFSPEVTKLFKPKITILRLGGRHDLPIEVERKKMFRLYLEFKCFFGLIGMEWNQHWSSFQIVNSRQNEHERVVLHVSHVHSIWQRKCFLEFGCNLLSVNMQEENRCSNILNDVD